MQSAVSRLDDRREAAEVRVAIVGSGFAGLAMAIALERRGIHDFVVLERAGDVGGTWRDNTYPGCQCDVPSHLYSFSFAPNPNWSRTYSPQPEIQAYLQDCVERFGVRSHVRFACEVRDAWWDEDRRRWRIATSTGPVTAQVLVAANGALSEPSAPAIPGMEDFAGTMFHSASWKHDHDLTGRRVAVIGTGASAIQIVPHVQRVAGHLAVFQRTPPWVLPHTDRPISRLERALYRRQPALQRAVRAGIYTARELLVVGLARRPRLLATLRRLATAHLHRHVKDPELRRRLTPRYSPGCKRLLLSDAYYPALTRPNVSVVTEGIREIRPGGIVTADGVEHAVDTIVLATGFRVTNNPIAGRIRGRDGRTLAETWEESGLRAYLGTTVAGFPNLFLMTGPNTGIGHTSLVYMIESQVPYVVGALDTIVARDLDAVEVRSEPLDAYNEAVQARMRGSVWTMGGCASWYLDRHGRNTTLWPDFTWRYRRLTRRFDAESYALLARRTETPAEPAEAVRATG